MSLRDIAMQLFCQFDESNRGYITQDQLLNGSTKEGPFSEFSESEILSIFALLDKENKGVITLSDFTDAFVMDFNDENFYDDGINDNNCVDDDEALEDDNLMRDDTRDEMILINNNINQVTSLTTRRDSLEDREVIYQSASPQVFEYGSDESLPHFNYDQELYSRSSEQLYRPQVNENFTHKLTGHDRNHVKMNSTETLSISKNRYTFRRRDSLPTVIDPLVIKNARMKLLGAKKWYSVDQGIDRLYIAAEDVTFHFEIDNLRTQSILNDSSRDISKSANSLIVSLKNSNKDSPNSASTCYPQYNAKCKERNCGKSLFGSSNSLLSSSVRCSSCTSLRSGSGKYSSSEDLSLLRHSLNKKYLSHNNLSVAMKKYQKKLPRHVTQSSLDRDYNSDEVDEDSDIGLSLKMNMKHHFSNDNLLFSRRNGFIISCENVSAPVDVSLEKWETFIRNIGGVSLFGGNTKLRYLWKQIGAYQHDLMLHLEDFLKGVVEEHKSVLTKYQEIESTLNTKVEQHEKEMDSIYEEFEKSIQKELLNQERQFCEKEESLKSELKRSTELKDALCQDTLKQITDLSEKLDACREELAKNQEMRTKAEKKYKHALEDQFKVSQDMQNIMEENETLRVQIRRSIDQNKELNDCISQMSNAVEEEKDKYHSFVRRYEDLLEEKEFLEANISNLSWENVELRNMNKSLANKSEDSSISLSVDNYHPMTPSLKTPKHGSKRKFKYTSSPCPESALVPTKSPLLPLPMSLQDEITDHQMSEIPSITSEIPSLDVDMMTAGMEEDEMNGTVSTNRTIKEELDEAFHRNSSGDTISAEPDRNGNMMQLEKSPNQSQDVSLSQETYENEEEYINTRTSVRFASSVQSEFKVIFCGDVTSGKTSVIRRICYETFTEEHNQSHQRDYYRKQVPNGENMINLALWDPVGQERFNSIPPSYYRKTDIAIVMYDITNMESFINAKKWLKSVKKFIDDNVLMILVGNKMDLEGQRSISPCSGEDIAKENDGVFIEVSAKSGENIHSLIHILISTLVNQNEYVMIQNFFDISTVQPRNGALRRHPCCQ